MPKIKKKKKQKTKTTKTLPEGLAKTPTGIAGFDEITFGGLPAGRPTLLCGGPGCGKTIFGAQFLVNGIETYDEPGVFLAFEETAEDLANNVRSLGYDLDQLIADKKLAVDHIHLDPAEIEEAGLYDLEGLFVRLGAAVAAVGAKRVVIDTLEVLFGSLKDTGVLRSEVQRLFRWLRDHELTAIITAERGDGAMTRYGLEEYVSDCVVLLDQRIDELVTTRRMRVVKYRGSQHGANEYPFLIDENGISVVPMTSVRLDYEVSSERVPSGIADLDEMLGGEGFYRTSTIMASGSAGTGKSSLAAHFVAAACGRGERAIMFALEESGSQIVRNMHSVGVDLQRWIDKGLLKIHSTRPSLYGLEMHLLRMHAQIHAFAPRLVVLDPLSSFMSVGTAREVKALMVRLFDSLKMRQITGFMTYLTASRAMEETEAGISSLIDTWIEVRDVETSGERTRGLYVIKSRGMGHSNQVREFILSDEGVRLLDVYPGPDGIITGSARAAYDRRLGAEESARGDAARRNENLIAQKKAALEARVAALEAEFEAEAEAARMAVADSAQSAERESSERKSIATSRSRAGTAAKALRLGKDA